MSYDGTNYEQIIWEKFCTLSFLKSQMSSCISRAHEHDSNNNFILVCTAYNDIDHIKTSYDDLYKEILTIRHKIPHDVYERLAIKSYYIYNK